MHDTTDALAADAARHVENLEAIRDPLTRAAYVWLLLESERAGLRSSCNSGKVHAVRLHDHADRYLFSWSANIGHLLFYLRRPALDFLPGLAASAKETFASASDNPGGEITIRLHDVREAAELAAWLFARLRQD